MCYFKDNLILRWGEEGVAISLNNIKIKDNCPFSILRLRVVNYKPSGFINFGILFCVLRNRSVFKCLTNDVREGWFTHNLCSNINPNTVRIQLVWVFWCITSDSVVLIQNPTAIQSNRSKDILICFSLNSIKIFTINPYLTSNCLWIINIILNKRTHRIQVLWWRQGCRRLTSTGDNIVSAGCHNPTTKHLLITICVISTISIEVATIDGITIISITHQLRVLTSTTALWCGNDVITNDLCLNSLLILCVDVSSTGEVLFQQRWIHYITVPLLHIIIFLP